jgi:hypothetical protein
MRTEEELYKALVDAGIATEGLIGDWYLFESHCQMGHGGVFFYNISKQIKWWVSCDPSLKPVQYQMSYEEVRSCRG